MVEMDASANGHAPGDAPRHDDLHYGDVAPAGWRNTLPRVLGVLVFLILIVFWIWVFANRDTIAHNDEFNDPTYSEAAEAVCAKRQAAIAEIPLATAAENAVERGVLLEMGTTELEFMVAELSKIPPPANGEGADGVEKWLTDYEVYLEDRRRYRDILAAGEDPPFLISPSTFQDVRVTDLLNTFAEVNAMESCAPSGDV